MVFCGVECVEMLKVLLKLVESLICAMCTARNAIFAAAFCALFQMLIVCSQIIKKFYVYFISGKVYNIYRG